MSDDFNPRSTDAMFAQILANQKSDRDDRDEFRKEIRETLDAHNKRVGSLERWRDNIRGRLAIVSAAIALLATGAMDWVKAHFSSGGQ